jgi:hypothetical protein
MFSPFLTKSKKHINYEADSDNGYDGKFTVVAQIMYFVPAFSYMFRLHTSHPKAKPPLCQNGTNRTVFTVVLNTFNTV